MSELFSLGIDLGGTKIEAALVRQLAGDCSAEARGAFEIVARERVATPGADGYDAVLEAVAQLVEQTLAKTGRALANTPIGVGMPGAVSRLDGMVKNSNTVCLNGRPFRDDLSRRLSRAIAFDNDANCFALAEACLGAARAHRDGVVFGVILGTGVGGGIVIAGKTWPGPQSLAGEWGHHAVGPWSRPGQPSPSRAGHGLSPRAVCYCGKTGCLELYASGPAVERDYRARSGQSAKLAEIVMRRGHDVHAAAAIDELLEAFGRGLANVIDILDPSAIVLGGGVSNVDLLYTEGVERVARHVFNDELLTPILKNRLGDSAGVIGAALLPSEPG
jgi:fructokinase